MVITCGFPQLDHGTVVSSRMIYVSCFFLSSCCSLHGNGDQDGSELPVQVTEAFCCRKVQKHPLIYTTWLCFYDMLDHSFHFKKSWGENHLQRKTNKTGDSSVLKQLWFVFYIRHKFWIFSFNFISFYVISLQKFRFSCTFLNWFSFYEVKKSKEYVTL